MYRSHGIFLLELLKYRIGVLGNNISVMARYAGSGYNLRFTNDPDVLVSEGIEEPYTQIKCVGFTGLEPGLRRHIMLNIF